MITVSAKIQKLDGLFIELNQRNLLSIESSIFDRKDTSLPSWGIISNSGNISFVDSDGSIKALASNQELKSGMPITFFLNDTISNYSQSIGKFLTKKWDYNASTKEVNLSVADELISWQDTKLTSISYDLSQSKESQFLDGEQIYSRIISEMESIGYDITKFEELDDETINRLKLFTMPFFYIESESVWSVWSKFCVALQLHIYLNDIGKIVVKYNGGN